jgi:hypothetical protein
MKRINTDIDKNDNDKIVDVNLETDLEKEKKIKILFIHRNIVEFFGRHLGYF